MTPSRPFRVLLRVTMRSSLKPYILYDPQTGYWGRSMIPKFESMSNLIRQAAGYPQVRS